jgi:nucleoside-diphosphate-sugar epimerase
MKILLTGASGFLGEAMQTEWNNEHEIITVGRGEKAMVVCDLASQLPEIPSIEMVVHAAGKAHIVPTSDTEKEDFFRVNVQGTKNLLAALEQNQSLKKFVFISSVSVYGLVEGNDITEEAPLLAQDPYGKSKIEAEKIVLDWCSKRNLSYYILRLPLIAGKNAPGNLGAMVKGIKSGRYLSIGKAQAKKSMILASDLAKFISTIEGPSGVYNLTDGYHPSFNELELKIAAFYKKKNPFSLPGIAAKMLGFAGDIIGKKFPVNSNKLKKITSTLTFNDSRAKTHLHWKPREVLKGWEIE